MVLSKASVYYIFIYNIYERKNYTIYPCRKIYDLDEKKRYHGTLWEVFGIT